MTAGALTSLLRLLFLLSGDRGIKMHEKFFNKLNDEQKDIVKLVQQGLTNIEIGVELGYSADSIKKRLSVIYKKFGVRKRIELIDLIS